MIIGETTCDGKKKMYELLNELKRTHILHLPQGRDRAYEREGWYEECRLLKEELENFYGITITDDDLRAAVRRRNRLRAAQLEMFALQANQPAAMSGVDLMSTMFAGTFSFDIEAYTQQLEQKVAKLREAYDAGERPVAADAKRILITGCPVGGVINKIGRTIESNGGVVVCMDDCSGERTAAMMIDPDAPTDPARHRRPLPGPFISLGHDAQRRPHGQHPGHVREIPRRRWWKTCSRRPTP
ncbi:MAG: 2-hydroxyacyl-CoA dehydratase [Collinsella sp.]